MVRFHKSTKVDASEDKAWSVVRDLTAMGKLTGAANVRVEGMKRICTFSNGIVSTRGNQRLFGEETVVPLQD